MIDAKQVHSLLQPHQLVDGYPYVLDLENSRGLWMRDAASGEDYLDAFTCFASWPLGYNHPGFEEPAFREELLRAALNNPSNSDLYTREMTAFVSAFAGRVTPDDYPYHFWVAGGALAVENALKTAFDWKARKLGRTSFEDSVDDLVVLHFEQAFHGRSGYTLSVTNTLPDKVGLFPKFDWPRVSNPCIEFDLDGNIANDIEAAEAKSCAEIEAVFQKHGDKVAAILIEPMQGEGGDNHFRPEFLKKLRQYADQHEALLVFDEVQTGFFGSGKPWMFEHLDVRPDVVSFGKKTQVCGIFASKRLDEVPEHVFVRSSRINSTWGGNLVDMVRCRRFIEIIEQDNLAANVTAQGEHLKDGLRSLARDKNAFGNVRGRGSLVAFSLEDGPARDAMLGRLMDQKLLVLSCGTRSIRFRLPLMVTQAEVDQILERVGAAIPVGA